MDRLESWIGQSLLDLSEEFGDKAISEKMRNQMLLAYLGSEGRRRFQTNPKSQQIGTISYAEFSAAANDSFGTPILPALAFHQFRTCKQQPHELVADFVSRLRVLQADCSYEGFTPDLDLAYVISQNCYNKDSQKKLFATKPVNLESYVNLLQADETASQTASQIRGESSNDVNAVNSKRHLNQPSNRQSEKRFPASKPQSRVPRSLANGNCSGCNRQGHSYCDSSCPAKTARCKYCHALGHFENCCLKKQRTENKKSDDHSSTRTVTVQNNSTSEKLNTVSTVSKAPYSCTVEMVKPNGTFQSVTAPVDSGSDVSLLPWDIYQAHFSQFPLCKSTTQLHNYDGSPIADSHGFFTTDVKFSNRMAFSCKFYILPNHFSPIFGTDLMSALSLVLDGASSTVRAITAFTPASIAAEFPDLVKQEIGRYPSYQHTIVLSPDAQSTACKARAVPIAKREAVAKEIQNMVQEGIWEKVEGSSPWAHGMVVVPKPDNGVRITTDLSPLNKFVIPQRHPIPIIKDLFLELKGATIFSKLDLKKGYFHIELDPQSRPLTTTITHSGLFQYCRLPMGLTDSASVFQRLVSQTLADCPGCIAYIDDILIFGKTSAEHSANLQQVLQKLNDNNFRLNLSKCEFNVSEVTFLGHVISHDGIKPNPKNVDAIRNAPQPKTKRQVQSFLGMINYLREFLPDVTSYAEPLQQLTRTATSNRFQWNPECSKSFETLKRLVASNLKLAIFDPSAPTMVTTDASDIGLGAMLSQIQNGKEVPVSFASHSLQPRERNFATNEREALGCVWACEYWSNFLLGRHFTLNTDHSALQSMLLRNGKGRKDAKFIRWRHRLQQFDFTVQHRKGSENKVADALSRLSLKASELAVPDPAETCSSIVQSIASNDLSFEQFASCTAEDEVLQHVKHFMSTEWPKSSKVPQEIRPYYTVHGALSEKDGCLFFGNSVVVPTSLHQSLLHKSHVGHPGIVRAKMKLRETFWWPGMSKAIELFIQHCLGCQDSAKSNPKQKIPVKEIPTPKNPWEKVAIDVTGPFAVAPQSHRFIVVLIDYHSKFPEVLLTNSHDSKTIIKWLCDVFSRFGNPGTIVSDNGPEFISNEFKTFLKSRDIVHHLTPVYHPQENGLVEVFNRSLKHHVQACQNSPTSFSTSVQEFLTRFRAESPKPGQKSPAELFLKRRIRLPFELNQAQRMENPDLEQNATPDQNLAELPANGLYSRGPYKLRDVVRVKLPHILKGQSPYSKPLSVTEVLGNWTYRLSDGQKYNARRMRRFIPPAVLEVETPMIQPEPEILPRRSTRRNFGFPPRWVP